jgi:hypothetical protein
MRGKLMLPIVALAATTFAGCSATAVPAPPPEPPPVVPIAAEPPDEWNVFPDPLTGQVEIYHDGVNVGSVTGDEQEDPPLPRPHKSDDADDSP